ncbi:coatomer subunit alpha [Cichlidogyrus casuarinus]|uniref:Coatomer subunit alpha n=1 Tax=Cichlidogyrus casuarinus TaxID=1844966 RepID=A0ABD2PY92_9PLAT
MHTLILLGAISSILIANAQVFNPNNNPNGFNNQNPPNNFNNNPGFNNQNPPNNFNNQNRNLNNNPNNFNNNNNFPSNNRANTGPNTGGSSSSNNNRNNNQGGTSNNNEIPYGQPYDPLNPNPDPNSNNPNRLPLSKDYRWNLNKVTPVILVPGFLGNQLYSQAPGESEFRLWLDTNMLFSNAATFTKRFS